MNERTIFLEALERVDPIQRSAFLDTACVADAALRLRVDSLLKSHDEAGSFLGKLAPERLAEELGVRATAGEILGPAPAGDTGQALSILTPSDKPDSLGRLGSYEVQEVIGSGGMGIVLRAFDEKLHRVVAIKVMAAPLASNEHARRRFVREGRAAAAIRDDHVIGIHGVDEASGLPFLVMEYVVGRSLAQRLEADGPLPLAEILRIGGQIARGLAAAHAQGVVHRDIKPANILLENGVERVKITDFGLAHAVDDVRTTQPGTVIGTPEYMSPEQARGERVDHRSDLFSLGCVLYAMCAGRPPFRAESTVAIIRRVCDDTPRPLVEINPETPEWLVDLIDKLIAKDAGERFQSAAEVAELLGQYLAHVQQPAVNPQPAAIEKPRPVRRRTSATSHRRWSIAAAALLLLCAGLGLAESTGVTSVAATVIRIVRGDGTLVVEVDDPNIQVLVDGEELVINGAGPKEIRLRPGQHELHTVKDGIAVDTKLVTITRDGREVVKVSQEAPPAVAVRPTTRLVWGDEADTSGALSPDGRYLATTDWETGDLALRDLATGKTRHVTTIGAPRMANGFAIQPLFSADGRQLAFTWNYRKEGDAPNNYQLNDLRVVSVSGGEPRIVFDDPAKYAEAEGWSADGKWILASLNSAPERQELAQVEVNDKSVRVFHTIDSWRKRKITRARLSPDGKTIAYSRIREDAAAYSDILLVNVQSEKETQLVSHAADKHVLGWTPDGRLLYDVERQGARDAWLLRVVDGKPHGEAILMKKDLGTISPLGVTNNGALYYASSSRSPSLYTGTLNIAHGTVTVAPLAAEQFNILDQLWLNDWSPDGEQLAYSVRLPIGTPRKAEMRFVSLKTGQKRAFELEQAQWTNRFRWSPDGQSLLGPRWIGEAGFGVSSIDVASGQATTVAERGSRPIWAREGKGIFYYKGDREPNAKRRIVHRDLQTQAETDVFPDDLTTNLRERSFLFETSPDGQQLAVLSAFGSDSLVLRIVPVAGGVPRELFRGTTGASSDAYNRVLAWTRDGQYLIFKRHDDDTQSGLWYISTDGGEPRKLAVSGANAKQASVLAIHPDGTQVALSISGTSKTDLWALENFLPPLDDSKPSANKDASPTKSK